MPEEETSRTNEIARKTDEGPGGALMGVGGIALVVGYTVVVLIFVLYSLLALWPPARTEETEDRVAGLAAQTPAPTPSPAASPAQSPVVSPTPTPPATPSPATPTPTPTLAVSPAPATAATRLPGGTSVSQSQCERDAGIKEGFCLDETGMPRKGIGGVTYWGRCYCMYDEDRLLLIVLLAGALGALVHALRSLSWYIGNREAVWSWGAMYFMLPFLGAALAFMFYLVIRGGFFSPGASVGEGGASPFGFAAVAALIGMFTENAVNKLQSVAATIFERPEKGKDHVDPAPHVDQISANQGSTAGGESVTLTGKDISNAVKVSFGGAAATIQSSNATSITVTTPPHAKGKVDVVITNADGQQHVLKEAFEYVDTTGAPGPGADKPADTVTTTAGEGEEDVEKIDGCDVDIEDETPDEDLPMTEGGVR